MKNYSTLLMAIAAASLIAAMPVQAASELPAGAFVIAKRGADDIGRDDRSDRSEARRDRGRDSIDSGRSIGRDRGYGYGYERRQRQSESGDDRRDSRDGERDDGRDSDRRDSRDDRRSGGRR